MDATAIPKRSHKKKEFHTSEVPPPQPNDIDMGLDEPVEHPDPDIVMLHGIPVTRDYLADLAFMEEPMEVVFNAPTEKFGAPYVDCFNNGKGIERWFPQLNRWFEVKQVPVAEPVIIKRKYVEIFARAKEVAIRTEVKVDQLGEEPHNRILRSTVLKHPFTVRTDTPKGHDWLIGILSQH